MNSHPLINDLEHILDLFPSESYQDNQNMDSLRHAFLHHFGLDLPRLVDEENVESPWLQDNISFEDPETSRPYIHPSWTKNQVDRILVFRLKYLDSRDNLIQMIQNYWATSKELFNKQHHAFPIAALTHEQWDHRMQDILEDSLTLLQNKAMNQLCEFIRQWQEAGSK